jgi:hypothetical protein
MRAHRILGHSSIITIIMLMVAVSLNTANLPFAVLLMSYPEHIKNLQFLINCRFSFAAPCPRSVEERQMSKQIWRII